MKSTFKIFSILILFLITTFSFGQRVSPFRINGELFEVPGKWEYLTQVENSGQYHFSNKKKELSLLISVRKPEKFEFYEEGLSEKELLNKFYKWDFDHWNSPAEVDIEVSEIKKVEEKNYVIWKLVIKNLAENNHQDLTSCLLYGVRNNNLIAITLSNQTDSKKSFD